MSRCYVKRQKTFCTAKMINISLWQVGHKRGILGISLNMAKLANHQDDFCATWGKICNKQIIFVCHSNSCVILLFWAAYEEPHAFLIWSECGGDQLTNCGMTLDESHYYNQPTNVWKSMFMAVKEHWKLGEFFLLWPTLWPPVWEFVEVCCCIIVELFKKMIWRW